MKSNMEIATEYTVCGLTAQGKWRPVIPGCFRSYETAKNYLEEHKQIAGKPCKVMKRTSVVVLGEWEEA